MAADPFLWNIIGWSYKADTMLALAPAIMINSYAGLDTAVWNDILRHSMCMFNGAFWPKAAD
jgi:hypothetical protein